MRIRLHLYHGLMPDTRVGHAFGHEFIGVVEDVGSSVQTVKREDRVMVPFNIYSGPLSSALGACTRTATT